MTPGRLLDLVVWGFVLAVLVIVVLRIFTGSINLRGLLGAKDGSGNVSPERVQLLALTIAAGLAYINQVANSHGSTLPDVSSNWLYVYGGSTSLYAAGKFWRTFMNEK